MKKTIFIIFAVLIMLFINTLPGFAARAGNYRGSGNYHGSGSYRGSGNYYGPRYYRGSGSYYGPRYYRGSGSYYGPRYYRGGNIWIEPGWGLWWGSPYYSYPYYPYYSYPYYPAPPVVNQQQQPVYVEPAPQQEEESYWYYCPDPQGYYPYVQRCPKGWLKVIPSPVPADEGE
jgi:hypothetical protein